MCIKKNSVRNCIDSRQLWLHPFLTCIVPAYQAAYVSVEVSIKFRNCDYLSIVVAIYLIVSLCRITNLLFDLDELQFQIFQIFISQFFTNINKVSKRIESSTDLWIAFASNSIDHRPIICTISTANCHFQFSVQCESLQKCRFFYKTPNKIVFQGFQTNCTTKPNCS